LLVGESTLKQLYNGDFRDLLDGLPRDCCDMVFADPPDNLGLNYDTYKDSITSDRYYDMIEAILRGGLRVAQTVWLSYYWQHDVDIKHRLWQIKKYERPSINVKTFIWRYTFGQHNAHDFGSGFRFLLRLTRPDAIITPPRVQSERQRMGDPRANPLGRIPDDFWCFDIPRVVGNAEERRPWHPTQHPELLMSRIIESSSRDSVIDLFAGTGTTFRVAGDRAVVCSELSQNYCQKICAENSDVNIISDPRGSVFRPVAPQGL